MFKKICSLAVFSFVIVTRVVSIEIEYDIHDIGTLQTRSSEAIALNNQGQILGWYNIDDSKEGKHFFVRDREGNFSELPCKESEGGNINWRYLTDNGKAYGFCDGYGNDNDDDCHAKFTVLYIWDKDNGSVKIGFLPGKEIVTVNNVGQILINVFEHENGKSIRHPIIWHNGQITKLRGLEGDLGTESSESYGLDMNNNGDVVGRSLVDVVYKNNVYKFIHATKWVDGQVVDIHNKIPKVSVSSASLINDLGDVYISPYLVKANGEKLFLNRCDDVKKGGKSYFFGQQCVVDSDGVVITGLHTASGKVKADLESIWMTFKKIVSVNDNGEIITQGVTIYGEEHALLLVPTVKDCETEKDESESEETLDVPNQEIPENTFKVFVKNTIDAAFLYHTDGIEEKVRLLFLERYTQNQSDAKYVREPYRRLLMLEALEGIIDEIENLSAALHCENNICFWEAVQLGLKEKSLDWVQSVDAYIKIKTALLTD